jgi:predicted HTH transcriptional regulator
MGETAINENESVELKRSVSQPKEGIVSIVSILNKHGHTVFQRKEKTVEKTVEKILELIGSNPSITQKELMEKTGLTRRGVEWNLSKLKERGKLKRVGSDKGGHWEVVAQ